MTEIIAILLFTLGIFFLLVANIGLIRFPDFYSRAHGVAIGDTLGLFFMITGFIVYQGMDQNALKLLLIILFVMITNPTGTNALCGAAYKSGVKIWTQQKGKED